MRYRQQHRRRGCIGEAVHLGRQALRSVDHVLRSYGPVYKQFAQTAAPMLASAGYAQAAAILASTAQAADGYSQLRQQLGD